VEEFAAGLLVVDGRDGSAGGDHVVEVQPARDEVFAAVFDEPALEERLGADKEGVAFGG